MRFLGDSEPTLEGLLGEKRWGVLQHKICGRFRTKFWGDFWVKKGEFQHKSFIRFTQYEIALGLHNRKMHQVYTAESFIRVTQYMVALGTHSRKLHQVYTDESCIRFTQQKVSSGLHIIKLH